jgi:hypothetical protein
MNVKFWPRKWMISSVILCCIDLATTSIYIPRAALTSLTRLQIRSLQCKTILCWGHIVPIWWNGCCQEHMHSHSCQGTEVQIE